MKQKLLGLIFLVMAAHSQAGPLGIEMGDLAGDSKFENFNALSADDKKFIIGKNPPRAHSSFENYVVRFSKSEGACWIKAIGKEVSDDKYGVRTKSLVDKIAAQIGKKYGAYDKTDWLASGTIWDDADNWMMSLKVNERSYMYEWSTEEGSSLTNTNISKIYVYADATGSSDGRPLLEFYFNNYSACENESDQLQEDAF